MMAVQPPHSLDLRTSIGRLDATAATIQAAIAEIRPPRGWRLQQVPGHIDATWTGPDGRWARLSMRFVAEGDEPEGVLLMTFDCDTPDDETVDGALQLLEPLTAALRRVRGR